MFFICCQGLRRFKIAGVHWFPAAEKHSYYSENAIKKQVIKAQIIRIIVLNHEIDEMVSYIYVKISKNIENMIYSLQSIQSV